MENKNKLFLSFGESVSHNFKNYSILWVLKWFWKYENLNSKIKLSNNSSFVILIFAILKFRNIGRSTFRRSKIWLPSLFFRGSFFRALFFHGTCFRQLFIHVYLPGDFLSGTFFPRTVLLIFSETKKRTKIFTLISELFKTRFFSTSRIQLESLKKKFLNDSFYS